MKKSFNLGIRKICLFSLLTFMPFTELSIKIGFKYMKLFDLAAITLIIITLLQYLLERKRLTIPKYFVMFICFFYFCIILSAINVTFWQDYFSAIISLLFYTLLTIAIYNAIDSLKTLQRLIIFWISIMTIISLLAIYQSIFFSLGWRAVSATATFGNRNQLANYLLPVALLSAVAISSDICMKNIKLKIMLICETVVINFAAIVILSRGAWIALIVGYICLLMLGKMIRKKIVLILLLSSVFILPFYLTIEHRVVTTIWQFKESYGGVFVRFSVAKVAMKVAFDNLFTGIGFGNWLAKSSIYLPGDLITTFQGGVQTHDTYLGLLVESGIFALLIFICFLLVHIKKLLFLIHSNIPKLERDLLTGFLAGFIAILIHMAFFDSFLRPNFWLMLAFSMRAMHFSSLNQLNCNDLPASEKDPLKMRDSCKITTGGSGSGKRI